MALTTIDKVKEFLGISNTDSDTELTTLLGYADTSIKNYLGREIEESTYTDESHEADGEQKEFFLSDYPVNQVSAFEIKWDTDIQDSDSYEIDYSRGIVYMNTAPTRTPTKFTMTYTAGYDAGSIPEDLKMVEVMLTADLFKAGGGGNASGIGSSPGPVKSEKLGDYSVAYGVTDQAGGGVYSVTDMLKKYIGVLNNYQRVLI